jgi:hypothetical protein
LSIQKYFFKDIRRSAAGKTSKDISKIGGAKDSGTRTV